MAQLMPLPLTVSCFSKIQIGFTFLVLAHPGSPGQRAVKRVCVCVCVVDGNTHFVIVGLERMLNGLHGNRLTGTAKPIVCTASFVLRVFIKFLFCCS